MNDKLLEAIGETAKLSCVVEQLRAELLKEAVDKTALKAKLSEVMFLATMKFQLTIENYIRR